MNWNILAIFAVTFAAAWPLSTPAQPQPQRLNNLTALLLEATPATAAEPLSFTRPLEGWIFISATIRGGGEARLMLDGNDQDTIVLSSGSGPAYEAMRHVAAGNHVLRAAAAAPLPSTEITVKAIPELMYSGLGL